LQLTPGSRIANGAEATLLLLVGDSERAAATDKGETTQGDWFPPGVTDLVRRLERMPDKYPSSTRYDVSDRPLPTSAAGPTDRLDRLAADGGRESGGDVPNVRTRPDRPNLDNLQLTDDHACYLADSDGSRH
jgi:hypothetical protein